METKLLPLRPVDLLRPIAQEIDGICGETCLTMVYRAFGERVDERQIVAEVMPDLGMIDSKYFGGSLHIQLIQNALLHGYDAHFSYDTPFKSLGIFTRKMGLPVIVEWMTDVDGEVETDEHMSVVTYADNEKVKMADPSEGKWRWMDRHNFERKWMGFNRDGSIERRFALVISPKDYYPHH
jgi:ABC-type bacteriocin/lantibiotic exporter with double-glycine peptidase domain